MAFRPPEYAALINPMAVNAFAIRIDNSPEFQKFCQDWCVNLHGPEIGPREWSPRTGKCICKKRDKPR